MGAPSSANCDSPRAGDGEGRGAGRKQRWEGPASRAVREAEFPGACGSPSSPSESQATGAGGRGGAAFRSLPQGRRRTQQFGTSRRERQPPIPQPRCRPAPRTHSGAGPRVPRRPASRLRPAPWRRAGGQRGAGRGWRGRPARGRTPRREEEEGEGAAAGKPL